MKRRFRLARSTDFKRVRRFGKSYAHPLVVLVASPHPEEQLTRMAVTAGAAVGGAVVRNKAKRRLRACLDEIRLACEPGWDLIVIARKPIAGATFMEIRAAVRQVLIQARILKRELQDRCD